MLFRSPFGSSIYCLIDMLNMGEKEIDELINDSLLLHSKLNSKKLHIKVINPTYSKVFEKIKSYHNHHINVMIDYFETKPRKALREDTEKPMIKISLRSVGTFPCNQLAAEFFNGGGHLNASGGEFFGTIEEAKAVFEQALEKYKPLLTAKS